jgi:Carboxypeptidase regulatory-like domain
MVSARLCAAVFASLIIFAAVEVQASDSAECSGVVLDENSVPVVAAKIRLERQGGQEYRAETNDAGRFTFQNLPDGDYKVEVRKEGFFLLTDYTIALHAGNNELSLTLNHAQELHEQVQVTVRPDQIDPQETSQRSTLTARDIRDIPVPNTHVLQQSLIALPEIVQDHQDNIHVAGARSGETQYLLDGFEIGDPVSGALTSRFNVDATRAAEVQTGRFGAGYAHAGASILSLETPDGDDRWRFGTTNPFPGINIQEGAHLGNWYPRFTFSGPLERGRFWFSDSVSLLHTFAVVKQQPAGANTSEEWAGDNLLRQSTFCTQVSSITGRTTRTSGWTHSIRNQPR